MRLRKHGPRANDGGDIVDTDAAVIPMGPDPDVGPQGPLDEFVTPTEFGDTDAAIIPMGPDPDIGPQTGPLSEDGEGGDYGEAAAATQQGGYAKPLDPSGFIHDGGGSGGSSIPWADIGKAGAKVVDAAAGAFNRSSSPKEVPKTSGRQPTQTGTYLLHDGSLWRQFDGQKPPAGAQRLQQTGAGYAPDGSPPTPGTKDPVYTGTYSLADGSTWTQYDDARPPRGAKRLTRLEDGSWVLDEEAPKSGTGRGILLAVLALLAFLGA